ncbi:M48 family metalloprotease [Nocardia inohanensis]|uniref:M48 family metalloprotease n=1 Tax=Nocardia inohanensis TaxID=209246 RepID=UPI001471B50A|nr:M48 family metalloprotease [Nocardia inohanensis]
MRIRGFLSATLALPMALPAAALTVLVILRIGDRYGHRVAYALFGLWAVAAVALLLLNSSTAARLFLRPPGDEDPAKLARIWPEVLAAAGLTPTRRNSLWVNEHERGGTEAFVVGGVVAVDREAARTLSTRALRGVLAHELGHYLARTGDRLRLLASALSFPVRMTAALAVSCIGWLERLYLLPDAGCYAIEVRMFRKAGLCALLTGVVAHILGVSLACTLITLAALEPILRHALHRHGETVADRVAADLGYGPDLLVYLRFRAEDPPGSPWPPIHTGGLTGRFLRLCELATATHPQPEMRTAAVEARIRLRESRSDRGPQS